MLRLFKLFEICLIFKLKRILYHKIKGFLFYILFHNILRHEGFNEAKQARSINKQGMTKNVLD